VPECKQKYLTSNSTVLLNFQRWEEGNLSSCFWMDTKVKQKPGAD
jgi:hypothetical protein